MGLATRSYASTVPFLGLPGVQGRDGPSVRPPARQARDFQLLPPAVSTSCAPQKQGLSQEPLPVQRAGGSHARPADIGEAAPENSS